jgi:hypothetical protein
MATNFSSIVASTFTDSSNFAQSFNVIFPDTAPDTATTLIFPQLANQTLTFPNLNGLSDFLVCRNTSGTSASVQNWTIATSTISSLTAPLAVQYGGTGSSSITAGRILVGNGATITTVSLPSGNLLQGSAGTPIAATVSGSSSAAVTTTTGNIAIRTGTLPICTKSSTGNIVNSLTMTNFLAIAGATYVTPSQVTVNTGAGTCTIAGGTLQIGDVIYIVIEGIINNNSGASRSMDFEMLVNGTQVYVINPLSLTNSATARYFEIEGQFVVSSSTITAFATCAFFATTTSSVRSTWSSPGSTAVNLANPITIAFNGEVSNGNVQILPDVLQLYLVRTTL